MQTSTKSQPSRPSNLSVQSGKADLNVQKADANAQKAEPDAKKADPATKKADLAAKKDPVVSQLESLAKNIATEVVQTTIKKTVKEIITKEKFPQPSKRLQRIAEPSMTSYVNLYNNYRNVLKPEKVLRIEEKMADLRKYSQVISDDLKILIVDKVNGINQNQAEQLQIKIMECLDSYVNSNSKQIPRFLETSYAFKCVKFVCADEFTVSWLKDIIGHLSPPPWKGARLEVTLMSAYSIFSSMSQKRQPKSKEGRIKFVIPITTKKVEFVEVAKRIEMCNPPIKANSWKKLKEEIGRNGTLYYVSIDNDCLKEIRKKEDRLFYLLGTIKITILDENEVIDVKPLKAE